MFHGSLVLGQDVIFKFILYLDLLVLGGLVFQSKGLLSEPLNLLGEFHNFGVAFALLVLFIELLLEHLHFFVYVFHVHLVGQHEVIALFVEHSLIQRVNVNQRRVQLLHQFQSPLLSLEVFLFFKGVVLNLGYSETVTGLVIAVIFHVGVASLINVDMIEDGGSVDLVILHHELARSDCAALTLHT